MIVKQSADSLASSVSAAAGKLPAPVHLWDPPYCGEMDLAITADGRWVHEGAEITREALVRLFASVLKREGGRHFLVTPAEKIGIIVEDAPFLAVDMIVEGEGAGQRLVFVTNLGERAMAGAGNPLRVTQDSRTGAPRPYVEIRNGLEARIDRKTFYRMVDRAEEQSGWLGVTSGGTFFPIAPAPADEG